MDRNEKVGILVHF